jgi:hypothetical protein
VASSLTPSSTVRFGPFYRGVQHRLAKVAGPGTALIFDVLYNLIEGFYGPEGLISKEFNIKVARIKTAFRDPYVV